MIGVVTDMEKQIQCYKYCFRAQGADLNIWLL
jgi:hypothetical protein